MRKIVMAVLFAVGGTVMSILGPTYISRIADLIGEALYGEPVNMQSIFSLMILRSFSRKKLKRILKIYPLSR